MCDEELKEISAFIKDQLAKEYIHPSKSPQTSLVFFIPKKDRKKRMVMDYRYLNKGTVQNNYLWPLISQLINKLKRSDMYTKMNLCWGYNNIYIKGDDEWKGAFVTPIGSYEPIVMFFRMCNSSSTFQQMMNMFCDEMHEEFLVIYMDLMIFIRGISHAKHAKLIKCILQKLCDNDLFVKPSKCTFFVELVDFLGMMVSKDGMSMDPIKISVITDYEPPWDVKGVHWFLGMANFYHWFILEFTGIAKPLMKLTKKDHAFIWGPAE